jgi:hypothetical protein
MLNHDTQGFLTGEPLELKQISIILSDILSNIKGIRKGIAATKNLSSTSYRTVAANESKIHDIRPSIIRRNEKSPRPASVVTNNYTQNYNQSTPAIPAASGAASSRPAQMPTPVSLSPHGRAPSATVRIAPVQAKRRDEHGRFIKNQNAINVVGGRGHDDDDSPSNKSHVNQLISSVGDKITGSIESLSTIEDVDPSIKAFKEIAQPVQAVFGGAKGLLGKGKEKVNLTWFRRIFGVLTSFKKEETTLSKAANKRLKELADRPEAKEEGGKGLFATMLAGILAALLGLASKFGGLPKLGGMLSRAPLLGRVFSSGSIGTGSRIVAARAGSTATNRVGNTAAGATREVGSARVARSGITEAGAVVKPGKLAKLGKLAKKIPYIGTLLGGLGATSDIYASESDQTLTRKDKDKKAGSAIGGFAGGLAGMGAGASLGASVGMLGGPIGVAIGGFVGGAVGMFLGEDAGKIIGDTFGGWVNDLRKFDISNKISAAWSSAVSSMKSGWDSLVKSTSSMFSSMGDKATEAWKSVKDKSKGVFDDAKIKTSTALHFANDSVKKATGVDLASSAKKGLAYAKDAGSKAVDAVEKSSIGRGAKTVLNSAKSASNWVVGQTSKIFESGRGGAGTVSTGKGDHGGASYGTYQMSSKRGVAQDFIKASKYKDQFAGLKAGSPEFNAKWKEIAKVDPEFEGDQHAFIKKKHFDPAMASLKKDGIDLSKKGSSVQDSVWSTSVQFGAGGANSMFKKALKGKNAAELSDEQIVSAIQDYKIANNDGLFKSSSENIQAGTAKRAVEEKKRLVALARNTVSAPPDGKVATNSVVLPSVVTKNLPVTVSARNAAQVTMPRIAAPPVLPAAPVIQTKLNSSPLVSPAPTTSHMVGQDLSDRKIAHIVTGGLFS